jgi:hypothetical protein
MEQNFGLRIIELKQRIVSQFTMEDWEEAGLLTGCSDLINAHPRLYRSLNWGDEDYSGNVLAVLRQMAGRDSKHLDCLAEFLERRYPTESNYVSAKPSLKKLTFAPHVFEVPTKITLETDLVAVMMSFSAEFRPVHEAIKTACLSTSLRCLRVDDIWEASTVIQDIFNLLLRARVVIVDFSGRNPNVMYETGIAHTLGKLVIPVSQSLSDVPFDIAHHRVLKYLPNCEGLGDLTNRLVAKLFQINH